MDSSSQQQQQQPRTNTHLIAGHRTLVQPYMRRGATLRNGVRCGWKSLLCLTLGGLLLLIISGSLGSLLLFVIGAMSLTCGVYLLYLAAQQYKALPPDHPERLQYSSGVGVTSQGGASEGMVFTPQAAGVGGAVVYTGPQTNQPSYTMPVLAVTQPGTTYPPPPAGGGGYPGSYMAPSAGYLGGYGAPGSFKEDLPPAYEDIVKSTQYQ